VKLVQVVTALRWDDTRGIAWGSWLHLKKGMQARLDRTKTTGLGKKVQSMQIFLLGNLCFSGRPWHTAWQEICLHPSLDYQRDYLVPRYSTGGLVVREPADYEDAMAMTRHLLMSLRCPDYIGEGLFSQGDAKLFYHGVVGFWSEHSPRRFMNSRAAGMGVEKSKRDFLGRWMPQQSDNYVMTARQAVWEVQQEVMTEFRRNPGAIDESETVAALKTFMASRNYPKEMIDEQVARLELPDMGAGTPSLPEASGEEEDAQVDQIFQAASQFLGDDKDTEGVELELAACTRIGQEVSGKYLLSYSKNKRLMTIHKGREGCWRRPGSELKDFHFTDDIIPLELQGALKCKDCWMELRKGKKRRAASSSESGGSDSSSKSDDQSC
jgi:hypothetical protein